MRNDELILRVIPKPARNGALGFALIPAGRQRRGRYATVYAVGVAGLASRFKTPNAVLLGCTIAHELGHLLLGKNSHTKRGIMRASWTAWEVERIAAGDLGFTAEQRKRIARGWSTRNAPRDDAIARAD